MIGKLGRSLGGGRLFREKRGLGPAKWVLDFKGADGTRHRHSLSSDRRVAERLRAELIRARDLQLAGLGGVEGQSRALKELVTPYLDDLALRTTPSHFRMSKTRIARMLREIRAPRVRDLTPPLVMQYRTRRIASGAAHATVNHEVRSMKSMLNWATRCGLIAQNPIAHLKHLPTGGRHQRRRRRALSDKEIEAFLAASVEDDRYMQARVSAEESIESGTQGRHWCAQKRGTRIPQTPMWRAFLETGARFTELTSTTWADLDVARRTLVLRAETTKSGKSRMIPLRDGLVNELVTLKLLHGRARRRSVNPNERIFLSPAGSDWRRGTKCALRVFDRVLVRAGITKQDADGHTLDIHCLRHTAASRFARAGVPLVQAQRLLGHADPAITARLYTHLDAEDLRPAVDSLDPITSTRPIRAAQ